MLVFKEGDNIGVSKMLTFYRKEPFFLQAEYADPLAVPCDNHVIGEGVKLPVKCLGMMCIQPNRSSFYSLCNVL